MFHPAQEAFLPWLFQLEWRYPTGSQNPPCRLRDPLSPAWGAQTDGFATLLILPRGGGALWGLLQAWTKSETLA